MNPRRIKIGGTYTYRPLRERDRAFGKGTVLVRVIAMSEDTYGRAKAGYQIVPVEFEAPTGMARSNELHEIGRGNAY